MPDHFQIVILGGGPGGYVAALRAAQLNLNVAVVEEDKIGGTCLNRGCIPTKALYRSAEVYNLARRSSEYGVTVGDVHLDFARVMARKDEVVSTLVGGVSNLLKSAKVEVVSGRGEVADKHTVVVTDGTGAQRKVSCDYLIMATGSVSATPPVKGLDLPGVMTSEQILSLNELPKRLLVIGGGVIGIEFASIMRSFGVEVTVVEFLPQILPPVDDEIARRMSMILKKRGIKIYTGTSAKEVMQGPNGLIVNVATADHTEAIEVDAVLVATGRLPNFNGLSLDSLGVEHTRKGIKVNQYMETSVEGVYAIGDITGEAMLAHVASHQGIVAVEHLAGMPTTMDYHAVPNAIFTDPEIAAVGYNEANAKAKGIAVKVGKFPFVANGKALTLGETEGLVKVICDESGKVIGANVMGPHASDLIAELTLAVQTGVTAQELVHTIHAHPTLPEAVDEAAHAVLGGALHQARMGR
jgi:dihydrolipoamide dehydrogenase